MVRITSKKSLHSSKENSLKAFKKNSAKILKKKSIRADPINKVMINAIENFV